ncbi:MAG TPA: hypothetical protein P5572_01830 [Phycisphaerae bacterium]|nr:hypothetical protein [Phycisphaerales bacterium]HRX83740.1 hypothetical protein [Phycisphaerae bacterium]
MLPATARRVQTHTCDKVNDHIQSRTEENVERYREATPTQIRRRLRQLDREWDVERALQTNFAAVSLAGLALGRLVDRKWYLLPAVASGFMLQHALQGWCPPLPVMRRIGVRTMSEIAEERRQLERLLAEAQQRRMEEAG